jgi:hypothetical protein
MPSVSVSLTDDEFDQVRKAARKEKKSTGQVIAEIVRVAIKTEGAL